jgi:hypothetical protein
MPLGGGNVAFVDFLLTEIGHSSTRPRMGGCSRTR